MRVHYALTRAVRASAGLTFAAAAVAIAWAWRVDARSAPHTGVLVCVWTAAGAAVARAALLWIRRLHGGRWARAMAAEYAGVSLEKGPPDDPRAIWGAYAAPWDDEWWVRTRQVGRNLLFVAAAVTVPFVLGLAGPESRQVAALQLAGAEVATATVAEPPRVVRKEYDDDSGRVVGYYTELSVSVPGSHARLAVGPVWTKEPQRAGQRIAVLWAPSDPGLGGYAASPAELHRLAKGEQTVDMQSAPIGEDVWRMAGGIYGLVMLPWVFIFALGIDDDDLCEISWSPMTQTVHALFALSVAYGITPALSGRAAPGGLQGLCATASWFVLPLLIFTPVFRMIRENWRN
ncbi:hypothetical protein [Streptomyces luteireticuli]|uniref:DUF3592 domain-containing protein n=1 Tax=Streptomyces luteireticuli TaxID=173858 RepID=A0ABN0Z2G0_9ACTN